MFSRPGMFKYSSPRQRELVSVESWSAFTHISATSAQLMPYKL
ncbi:hypothetical protein MtrunA17_Chr4g0000051 [Medicago truncatula]|uniref:Uncharacterized protein n=1 Tax=Medicago truncatula TaxID=3880 RepID=A0A396I3Q2_MEDTR|nr:hypothetical protein MtrunA17_Chr4g0000051 [Medicago truncatula]